MCTVVLGHEPQDLSQYRKKVADAVDQLPAVAGTDADASGSGGSSENGQADSGEDTPKSAS